MQENSTPNSEEALPNDPPAAEKNPETRKGSFLAVGIGAGVAIGAGIGVATGNLAMGVGVGVAIGTALGLALGNAKTSK